ncbi:tryptophan halogenase family protein [Umezawaea sp.]|uniref:tryptophan halogenase family protein n=1 Tax=Umezawaea sp. TaxID=1955258 RepID=UPI002ED682F6
MTEDFTALLDALDPDEADAVRGWLGGGPGADPLAFLRDRERTPQPMPRPPADDPKAIRRVGVVGGGTAGYLTALALRAKRPWLEVTVVESSAIPVIGVGESTVQSIVQFLHNYLGIDPQELYRRVRPTWKLGIKFDWGSAPEGFMAPFDWSANSIGLLGSLETRGDINAFTFQSLLMAADRTPVYDLGGRYVSLMKHLPFSYHLDNQPLVAFLCDLARERGVRHVDAKIDGVELSAPDWVDHLRTDDGERLEFDFYVDCTGFRSVLLEKALGTPFHSYSDSLFTDSAVIGNVEHGGSLKPYTSAITMDAGWCWNIPTRDADHLGYVFSSRYLDDDRAAAELARRFPGVTEPTFIRFRSGRHTEAWRGNVVGIGNAFAFVEPLESSSLLMITLMVMQLTRALPGTWAEPVSRSAFNGSLTAKWDALRWFLAAHYRFNRRRDTPFWRDARAGVNVDGLEPLLGAFADGAPLQLRDGFTRGAVRASVRTFYDLQAYDCVLLGQDVPARLLPITEDDLSAWRTRKAAADALVRTALPQHEALAVFDKEPHLLTSLFEDEDSWAAASRPIRLV